MDLLTLENRQQVLSYLDALIHALSTSRHVAQCDTNLMTGTRDGDDFLVVSIDMMLASLNAMKLKYRYTGIIDKLPSNFTLSKNNSGYPIKSLFRELALEQSDDFNTYKVPSLPSSNELKSRLANIAMEEKRICKKTQFEIAIQQCHSLLKDEPFFTGTSHFESFYVDEDQGIYRIIGLTFDDAMSVPAMYIFDIKVEKNTPKDRLNEILIEFKKMTSSRYKLLTIAKKVDELSDYCIPIRLDRVFMGPIYLDKFTKNGEAISCLMSSDVEGLKKYIYTWTTESLIANGVDKVSSGFLSQSERATYDLDMLNPKSFEAGVTNSSQSLVIPYELYQILADDKDNRLNSFKKYVVEKQGHVMVF